MDDDEFIQKATLLLRYSFQGVDYKNLTPTEKVILSEEEYNYLLDRIRNRKR